LDGKLWNILNDYEEGGGKGEEAGVDGDEG